MAFLSITTVVLLTTAISHSAQASPLPLQPPTLATRANITYGMCYPADTSGGQPAISRPDCNFALQQFLQAHNATPNDALILTNDASKYANPSPENPYVENEGVFFPAGEPVGPDNVRCQLAYRIGMEAPPNATDTSITLPDFEDAASQIIANCSGVAFGGEVGVASAEGQPEGQQVFINVERAPY